jgi:hypothetical protein
VLARLPALHERGDTVRVGLERQQFGGVPQVAAQLGGVVEQDRLQVVLAAQAPGTRAEAGQPAARVDVLDQPLTRVAHQVAGLEDAVVVGEGGRGPVDRRLDAGHPEQLHRAHVVAASAGVAGGSGMALHEGVRHPQPAQEQ